MADNAIHSVQKLLQDLIAPDVRETKVRLEAFEKRVDAQFESMRNENASFRRENEAFRKEVEAVLRGVLSAIAELKSSNEATSLREIASLRERVAILEVQRTH